VSRGTYPSKLKESSLWWHGAQWLTQSPASWPNAHEANIMLREMPELRKTAMVDLAEGASHSLLHRYSALNTLLKVLALCFKFYHHCRGRTPRIEGPLAPGELDGALVTIVRLVQISAFSKEISTLLYGEVTLYPNIVLSHL
jgi:hypothetical protein